MLSQARYAADLVIACWDEEEIGLLGSEEYAKRARANDEPIEVAFVFEMIGYSSNQRGSQTVPDGFGLLFGDAVKAIEANQSRGDFITLVPNSPAAAAAGFVSEAASSFGLPTITLEVAESMQNSDLISDLRRSDHASFWAEGFPAIMITDTAEFRNPNYHCNAGPDVTTDLDYEFARNVVAATVAGVVTAAQ